MTDDPWVNFFVLLTVGANVAVVGLWALAGASLVASGASRFTSGASGFTGGAADAWARVRSALGEHGLAIAAVVAATAMAGSLYLSEGAHLPPCELCWYQRIAMYPLAVILVLAAVRRDWAVRPYALVLAAPGALVSVYHYLIERFPDWEQGSSCDPANPCTITWIWRLHYISIPLMALSAFLLVGTVLLAARRRDPDPHPTASDLMATEPGATGREELVG